MTTTWSTAELRACRLAAGDRIDLNGRTLTLMEVVDAIGFVSVVGEDPDVYVVESFNAYARVAVHVPNEPVDGYKLWQPKPGTFSYSGCTCVHRRDLDGSWRPIDNTCPACVHRATDNWGD